MKQLNLAILDVSDHVHLFEDELFKQYMFTDDLVQCTTFHVARNIWPSNTLHSGEIVKFLIENFDGVLIPGSEDCCMDDSLCYIGVLCEVIRGLVHVNFPLFGICFGAQAISRALFGSDGVGKLKELNEKPEFGIVLIEFVDENAKKNALFNGIEESFYSSSSHSDCFLLNTDKVEHLLKSRHWKNQAYQVKDKLTYGLQFHPEMDITVSQQIFNTVDVPIIHDDNVNHVDMRIGKIIAKNFCELIIKQKSNQ